MNPRSAFAYLCRHKRRALLLMALICLATLGVCIMVRLLDFLFEQVETTERYLTRVSVVRPLRGTLDPGVMAQIRVHPDVARVIPKNDLSIGVPLNTSGGFPVFGVSEADIEVLLDAFDLRLKQGRPLRARTNEILLSEEIAEILGLKLGDQIDRSMDERYFEYLPATMVLVGILESDPSSRAESGIRLGLVSLEFLDSHEVYASRTPSLFILPQPGRKAAMDHFLENTIPSTLVVVSTHRQSQEAMESGMLIFRLIFGIVDVLVAVVIALVVGTINRIALSQRIKEFGLLHAIGFSRQWLVRRLTLEMAVVAGAGWIAGLALSWLLFAWLKHDLFAPLFDMDLRKLTPLWFSVPIPLVVIAFACWSTMSTLSRLDAVSIIDRGQLAMEPGAPRRTRRSRTEHSTARPLSSWTFYRRHLRRGLTIALTMALMIVGVAFPAFLFVPSIDINRVLFEQFHYISLASPRMGTSIDPGVMSQLQTHPAVSRVAPIIELHVSISLKPMFQGNTSVYGVAEGDLPALVQACDLRLVKGRFPAPRSNELLLTEAVAMNRGLGIGDRVGRPVYDYDYSIPTEMVVVGILRRNPQAGDMWLGFASYEYLTSHEIYASRPVQAFILPAEGRKAELDAWLEGTVASGRTSVQTYGLWLESQREVTRTLLLVFGAIEGVVAAVAAFALAILSYFFFNQRQREFGTLHALGHSRQWLVLRTMGEAVTVIALAWLLGAVVCLAGLVYMRTILYGPYGLDLDLLNPAPWLFTLPMPLAVTAVSAGLVVWMLSRLDPVTIIERRS
jgi:ABC-type lipoprotein release transport system permease subunit